jgi:iron complex transport system substrate-binding protein
MKKTHVILIAIVLILIIAGSSYEVYTLNKAPSETTYQKGTVISVVDENGDTVNVTEPVNRIVCIDQYSTAIICALGCENRIVGRDALSTFPTSVTKVPSIGEDYSPSVEQVLELNPDLVIGDAMVNYSAPVVNQLEAAGIPVFLSQSLNLQPNLYSNVTIIDETCSLVTKLGLILDEQANASKLVNYMQYYNNLVNERLANLTTSEKPTVYYEWYFDWESEADPWVAQAGGINIVANESQVDYALSPEYVAQANPDVIIALISNPDHNITSLQTYRNEIMSRPALQDTTAVKEGNVYICDGAIYGGISCVVGYLQWAKWLHPSLFEDIDPATIHQQMITEFFGNITVEGVYSYP